MLHLSDAVADMLLAVAAVDPGVQRGLCGLFGRREPGYGHGTRYQLTEDEKCQEETVTSDGNHSAVLVIDSQ